ANVPRGEQVAANWRLFVHRFSVRPRTLYAERRADLSPARVIDLCFDQGSPSLVEPPRNPSTCRAAGRLQQALRVRINDDDPPAASPAHPVDELVVDRFVAETVSRDEHSIVGAESLGESNVELGVGRRLVREDLVEAACQKRRASMVGQGKMAAAAVV